MNTKNSWIKLPRKFMNWQWYQDAKMVHLYLYLLLNANIEDVQRLGISIKRGECLVSLTTLESDTGISRMSLKTCLKKLKETREIKYRKLNKGRIIVLSNFNMFQPIGIDESVTEWIKLYRKIGDWQWYQDAKMVHLFVHLMLRANIMCKNGMAESWQLCTSLRILSKETGLSLQNIRSCIDKLKKTGEITLQVLPTHQQSIITICNFNSYQSLKKLSNPEITHFHTDSNPIEVNALLESKDLDFPTQQDNGISGSISAGCRYENKQENPKVIRYNPDSKTIVSQCNPDNISKVTLLKEYKKRRIEENKKTTTDVARAYGEDFGDFSEKETSKENQQKKGEIETLLSLVLNDEVWLTAIKKKFALKGIEDVKLKVESFELDHICRGNKEHKDIVDYKSHFCDWLKFNLMEQSPGKRKSTPNAERWEGEKFVPKSSEGGIFNGPF